MSLVSTYVLADDGKWYREPVLADDTHMWFICFDDDEPPELVFREGIGINPYMIFDDIGLKAKLKGGPRYSGRLFDNEFHDAISVFLKIKRPIPADRIKEHDGIITELPAQGVMYDFGKGYGGLK